MTNEEAIRLLNKLRPEGFINTNKKFKNDRGTAIDLAIQALEKQIPKRPNKFDGNYCPICRGKLARQTDLINQKYCHHCGQVLDWSDEID